MVEPRGIAPRSTRCRRVVLLLDDGPEMERAPGLAPGKSGFASRRLDDFGIARFWKWGGRRVLPPLGDLHRIECWLLHHGLRLKVILRPALPRHGLLYERSALLTSATEESKVVLPRGLAPRTSAFAKRRAELLHLGSYELNESKTLRHAGAAPAPAVWKTAVLAVTPMTRMKVVAASGIAPDSPRLQRGANLSQLHSQWSLRAVSRRGLSLIGRGLCF